MHCWQVGRGSCSGKFLKNKWKTQKPSGTLGETVFDVFPPASANTSQRWWQLPKAKQMWKSQVRPELQEDVPTRWGAPLNAHSLTRQPGTAVLTSRETNSAGGRQRRFIPHQIPPALLQEGNLHIPGVLCCFSSPPAGSPGPALLSLLRLPSAQTAFLFPPLPLSSFQALPQPLYAMLTATAGKEVPGHHPSDPSPSLLRGLFQVSKTKELRLWLLAL